MTRLAPCGGAIKEPLALNKHLPGCGSAGTSVCQLGKSELGQSWSQEAAKAASASRQIAAPKIGRFERLFRVRAGLRSLSDRCPLCAHYSRSPPMRRFSKADVWLKDAYGRTRANSELTHCSKKPVAGLAAGRNRHGHRDVTMVLVAYRLDIDQIFRPQMYSNTLLN